MPFLPPVVGKRVVPEILRARELALPLLGGRTVPVPHPGTTVELAVVEGSQMSWPQRHESQRADLHLLPMVTLGDLARELPLVMQIKESKGAQLAPRQIQGFGLAHPEIYTICELLRYTKGLLL